MCSNYRKMAEAAEAAEAAAASRLEAGLGQGQVIPGTNGSPPMEVKIGENIYNVKVTKRSTGGARRNKTNGSKRKRSHRNKRKGTRRNKRRGTRRNKRN